MFFVSCDMGRNQGQISSVCSMYVYHQSVSEESDSQERQWRKYSSVELRSLHWNSSSGQGQTTADISERHAEGKSNDQLFSVYHSSVHHKVYIIFS